MTGKPERKSVNRSGTAGVYKGMSAAEGAISDAAVVGGSSDAQAVVAQMYREHYTPLVRTIAMLVRDAAEAEDIVQEAHLRLYRSWDQIRDQTRAPAYLRSTAINLARSRLRMMIRARGRDPEPKHATAPDEAAIAGEANASLIRSLKALPRRQRECLVLHYYLDLSEREIAEALGVSMGAVKQHLHRGREKLEQSMERFR
jgi:RNA polymerase sigma-70 factor (sigma-E family)